MKLEFLTKRELLQSLHPNNLGERPVVWALGSGLTTSRKIETEKGSDYFRGVPGVAEMTRRLMTAIQQCDTKLAGEGSAPPIGSDEATAAQDVRRFAGSMPGGGVAVAEAGLPAVAQPPPTVMELGREYRRVFETARRQLNADTISTVIREAVLEAYNDKTGEAVLELLKKGDETICADADKDPQNWILRPGLRDFGQIVAKRKHLYGQTILTTNFDPLIEVSIRSADGSPTTAVMQDDGSLGRTQTDEPLVVHLHGYWHGSSYRNTDRQLEERRLRLQFSLKNLFDETGNVYVIGYGGWVDVLTSVLSTHAELDTNTTIHWCFQSNDSEAILKEYEPIFRTFEGAINHDRFRAYKGIDADEFFGELLQMILPFGETRPQVGHLIRHYSRLNAELETQKKELFRQTAALTAITERNDSLEKELKQFVENSSAIQIGVLTMGNSLTEVAQETFRHYSRQRILLSIGFGIILFTLVFSLVWLTTRLNPPSPEKPQPLAIEEKL